MIEHPELPLDPRLSEEFLQTCIFGGVNSLMKILSEKVPYSHVSCSSVVSGRWSCNITVLCQSHPPHHWSNLRGFTVHMVCLLYYSLSIHMLSDVATRWNKTVVKATLQTAEATLASMVISVCQRLRFSNNDSVLPSKALSFYEWWKML